MKKTTVLTAVALALVLVALGATASAEQRFESTVTIHAVEKAHGTFTAEGEVKSSKKACEKQRKVVLYGRQASDPQHPDRLGADRTNDAGAWRVSGVDSLGLQSIQAQAKPKQIAAGTCKRARSRTIHFA